MDSFTTSFLELLSVCAGPTHYSRTHARVQTSHALDPEQVYTDHNITLSYLMVDIMIRLSLSFLLLLLQLLEPFYDTFAWPST